MRTIYSARHHRHHGRAELIDGTLQPCFEMPRRAEMILARVREVGLGEVVEPRAFGLDPVRRVHDAGFVGFLATAWADWTALGRTNDALPLVWPVPSVRHDRVPDHIDGRLGFYSSDAGVPITAGTWDAVQASAHVALTGAEMILEGAASAFALCRPPGHHAAAAAMGGYCYLNNAAIAAQHLRDRGLAKVAVLDVDYHHGNGTQQIFYGRDDVQYVSLHGDPGRAYPYVTGYADERGAGRGVGANLNVPLAAGTDDDGYLDALGGTLDAIATFGPGVLIVSLGVDTYHNDPISDLAITTDGFRRQGGLVADLGLPTVVLQEGGYDVDAIGDNVRAFLLGMSAIS